MQKYNKAIAALVASFVGAAIIYFQQELGIDLSGQEDILKDAVSAIVIGLIASIGVAVAPKNKT